MAPKRSPIPTFRLREGLLLERPSASSEEGGQFQPSSAKIEVGTVALADVPEALWQDLAALLSDDEWARAERFHFERNRREYVAAHALKRLMLCEAAGGAPRDWAFTAEPGGKPLVGGGLGPHFNLSHCDGLVACALSLDVPLGVDVELIQRHASLDVAEHYFALSERAWLLGLPEAERPQGFFKLWTMKEAVIKATGKGIYQDLQTFMVSFDPLRIHFLDPARAEPGEWRFLQQLIGERHLLGLAWRGPTAAVIVRDLRFECK